MTDTLISIISIFAGILGANLLGLIMKKYSLGFTSNTLVGIFGSIFFIKVFGPLGIDPTTIMQSEKLYLILFLMNMSVSLIGGALGLLIAKFLLRKIQ